MMGYKITRKNSRRSFDVGMRLNFFLNAKMCNVESEKILFLNFEPCE